MAFVVLCPAVATADADDGVCRALVAQWPASGEPPPSSTQRWSSDNLDGLLAENLMPPLSQSAKAKFKEDYGDSTSSAGYAIEIGRDPAGTVGLFESRAGSAYCAQGAVLVERGGVLEIAAQIGEDIAPCDWGSIRLLRTGDRLVLVTVSENGETNGRHSVTSYDVVTYGDSSEWAHLGCGVRAVYNDALSIEWHDVGGGQISTRLRATLEPVTLAVMRAGDLFGNKADITQAFAPVVSPDPPEGATEIKLRALLGPDNAWPRTAEGADWAGIPEGDRPPRFDAVARLVNVGGLQVVLAVGRYWGKGGLPSDVPFFQVIGWNGTSYIQLAHGLATVQSTFDHAEIVSDQNQE